MTVAAEKIHRDDTSAGTINYPELGEKSRSTIRNGSLTSSMTAFEQSAISS
jgi:hypothetical protein